jgi:hypothetical protein
VCVLSAGIAVAVLCALVMAEIAAMPGLCCRAGP